jgi:hypothetical protein
MGCKGKTHRPKETTLDLADAIRAALAEPAVRVEVISLTTGESERRTRRLQELEEQLDEYELQWQKKGDGQ